MKLACALVACNDNPHYLSFWPLVKKAWNELVGIPVKMVYVADTLHPALVNDPAVIHFKPLPDWPTATQAQCIRLLYPGLLDCSGAVVISDMDMLPLNKDFFHEEFARVDETKFLSLREPLWKNKEIFMCYVGATPWVWRQIFHTRSIADVRENLYDWAKLFPADGRHGSTGWTTDQRILFETIEGLHPAKRHYVNWRWEIPRLCRSMPQEWETISMPLISRLCQQWYIDYHLPALKDEKTVQTVQYILHLAITIANRKIQ